MPRGGKRPGAGRPAGSQNRDTAASRAALADLVAGHVETAIATLGVVYGSVQNDTVRKFFANKNKALSASLVRTKTTRGMA